MLESENLREYCRNDDYNLLSSEMLLLILQGESEKIGTYQSYLIISMEIFLHEGDIKLKDLDGKDAEEIIELDLWQKCKEHYNAKEEQLSEEQMREFEKVIVSSCG